MNDRCIPNPDVIGRVDTTFTQLDQRRTEQLERLQQIQTVQNTLLVREHQRLIAKYGEEHPRVQKATARLTYNQGLQRDLSQEVERSKIEVTQLDRRTWQGHGFVLNTDLVGLQGLTISFVDAQNSWVRELGYACTDERGYFSLLYPKPATEMPPSSNLPPIFLTITDANRRVLHRESTSRTVQLGQVDFWRIVLGQEGGGTCEPPDNPDNPPGKAVQVQGLDAPDQLTVNQSGRFRAQVNDDATPPVAAQWDFGDGSPSVEGLTASHAYTKPGTYTVAFTASNLISKDSRTRQVVVQEAPPKGVQVLGIEAPPVLTVNQTGTFTAKINDDATPPVTSRWEFGDGSGADGLSVTHAYTNSDSFTITFTASNVAGKDSRTSSIRVRNAPKPPSIGDIQVSPEKPTTRTAVQFAVEVKGDATLTYQWEFGDGATSAEVTPSHTYTQANTYQVKLTVSNAAGIDSRSLTLTISKSEALTWGVRGQVLLNPAVQAAAGVIVGLFDPQNRFDTRRLGSTVTDEKGNYAIAYSSDTFPELFEARPELLVRVSDRQGTVLFTTDKTIRCTPGAVETVNITLRRG